MKITTLLLGTISLLALAPSIAQASMGETYTPAQKAAMNDCKGNPECTGRISEEAQRKNAEYYQSLLNKQTPVPTSVPLDTAKKSNDGYTTDDPLVSRDRPLDQPLNPETSLPGDLRDQANRGDTLWARGIEEKALEQARIWAASHKAAQDLTVTTGFSGGGGMFGGGIGIGDIFGGIGGASFLSSFPSLPQIPQLSQLTDVMNNKLNGHLAGINSSISGWSGKINNVGGILNNPAGAVTGWTANAASKLTSLPNVGGITSKLTSLPMGSSVAGMIPSPYSMNLPGNLELGSLTAGLPSVPNLTNNGAMLLTSRNIVADVQNGAVNAQNMVVGKVHAGASAVGNMAATTVSTKASTVISGMTKMPGI